MQVILSNPKHPEYGQVTIPLPLPRDQYDVCERDLNGMCHDNVSFSSGSLSHTTCPIKRTIS